MLAHKRFAVTIGLFPQRQPRGRAWFSFHATFAFLVRQFPPKGMEASGLLGLAVFTVGGLFLRGCTYSLCMPSGGGIGRFRVRQFRPCLWSLCVDESVSRFSRY